MKKDNKITVLFFTLVVVMMGFGMILPILPYYVESFGASGIALGLLMSLFSIGQLIFSPIWGSLSDRIGRKPLLLIGAFGNALSMFLMAISTELWMLLVFRAFSGILSSATLPTAMAYIGDSTSEEDRGGGMGVIGAAMGMGMVLGPGIGGWLAGNSFIELLQNILPPHYSEALQNQTLSTPFYFAALLSLIAVAFIAIVLPESLPLEKRQGTKGNIKGINPTELWLSLTGPLGFLFFMLFLVSFGLTNFESVFGLYSLHRFDYGPEDVGTILTVIGLISAVVQGLLTGPATRRWGENLVIKLSLIGSAFGFFVMLMADNDFGVITTVGIFIICNTMLRPSLSSLISKQASDGQGMAMGISNSFMSIGRIAGPLWAGSLFDIKINYPYISGAIVMLVGFVLSLFFLQTVTNKKPRNESGIDI